MNTKPNIHPSYKENLEKQVGELMLTFMDKKTKNKHGDGEGGDGIESRVARLESDVSHIKETLVDIKTDIREIRGDITGIKVEIAGLRTEIHKGMNKMIIFSTTITLTGMGLMTALFAYLIK